MNNQAQPKAKINAYICELLHATITEDIHDGVTPFIIACPECKKSGKINEATSKMYRVNQELVPTHEWYSPTPEELKDYLSDQHPSYHQGTVDHVKKGGLLFREKKEWEANHG